jgi:hypothetical protein
METAFVHCKSGGVALFVPDHLRDTFRPSTSHGGNDGEGRGLRYLEWCWDPDSSDTSYVADFTVMLREPDGSVQVEYERHTCGLFSRETWLRMLSKTGFRPEVLPFEHTELEPGVHFVFTGIKP